MILLLNLRLSHGEAVQILKCKIGKDKVDFREGKLMFMILITTNQLSRDL